MNTENPYLNTLSYEKKETSNHLVFKWSTDVQLRWRSSWIKSIFFKNGFKIWRKIENNCRWGDFSRECWKFSIHVLVDHGQVGQVVWVHQMTYCTLFYLIHRKCKFWLARQYTDCKILLFQNVRLSFHFDNYNTCPKGPLYIYFDVHLTYLSLVIMFAPLSPDATEQGFYFHQGSLLFTFLATYPDPHEK